MFGYSRLLRAMTERLHAIIKVIVQVTGQTAGLVVVCCFIANRVTRFYANDELKAHV